MIGYPFIKDLFTNVLLKSKAVQGRLFFCPKRGSEINADELDQVIKDLVIPEPLKKKYPLVLMMPPMSYGSYTDKNGEWETFRFILFFLNTTFYSSAGQVMAPNANTRTSTHEVSNVWHDMKRVATNFIYVLDKVSRTQGLIKNKFRLDQDADKIIQPLSFIGTDSASGVRIDFQASVMIGCELEDYDEGDIAEIEIPEDDSHPEHQL